jgi:hypothetical protein
MKLLKILLLGAIVNFAFGAVAADKKIVLIAGRPSHPPGMHEFRAGCLLLKKCLDNVPGVTSVVYSNGWPSEASAFDGADAVLIFSDGGGGNPAMQGDHAKILGDLVKKGVGLGFAHFAVEVPKDKGGKEFQEWIGGYYEDRFSCNPMWAPEFKQLPSHPITRGVKPFASPGKDEWYFNMRFRPEMKGVTPILVAKPSDEVRKGRYVYPPGPYEHVIAASGREEVLMWVCERPDGGRGMGFTGGHTHAYWNEPNLRKVVLNSLLWLAKAEVPANGAESMISDMDLKANLDRKGR